MARTLIVGGGLAGSLLALYLARRGHDVDVFERHSNEPVGRRATLNITLCERGLAALAEVGMREPVLALAVPARGRIVHGPDSGTVYQPYGNKGEAIYSISRGDLNRALVERAARERHIRFHFDHKCTHLDLQSCSVQFENTRTHATTVERADCIFGADGAFSAVRAQMQHTEHFNYSQEFWRQGGYKSIWLPPRPDGAPALPGEALHIWPRGSRMLMGFPNRDGSATLSLLLPFRGENSFEQLTNEERLFQFFEAFFPDIVGSIPTLAEQFFAKPINSLLTVRCNPWSWHDRVLLIGDAAHALLPSYGQGANAAFEDCAVLDRCLSAHDEDWGEAFRAFEAERRPSLDVMATLCMDHFAELTDHVSDPKFLLQRDIERQLNELYPGLYRTLYSMVSFSTIPYDEAFRTEQRQQSAVRQIMTLDNVESRLETAAVREILEAAVLERPVEAPPAQLEKTSVLEKGLSFWGAKVLLSAAELGVFEALEPSPLTLEAASRTLGLHSRGAADFLDALTALGFLSREGGLYSNTPAVRDALLPGGTAYVGGALQLANDRLYPVWAKLSTALRTGQPQNEAQTERDYYSNLMQDPVRLRAFLRAMSGLSIASSQALSTKFPWHGYHTFADVGGAQGVLSVQLLQAHPHLTGINFDLPPVQPIFEAFAQESGVSERVRFQGGDFFVDPLPAAEVIVLGHVLHNWGLDQKRVLIEKVFDVLPVGGALIVLEALIDDQRKKNAFGLLMSLNMLLVTSEGFVFTGAECQAWMKQAGFSRSYVQALDGPDGMVVAIK